MQHIHHLWHKKRFSNYGQISFGTHFNVSFYSTWLQHPSFGLYHCIPYCRKFFIDHCINGILIRNRHQLSWWLGNGYKIINKMNTQIYYISIFSWNSMARPLQCWYTGVRTLLHELIHGPFSVSYLGVYSGYAWPITGQVTSVTWPVTGWA